MNAYRGEVQIKFFRLVLTFGKKAVRKRLCAVGPE
jgi:hypothetical protein